MLPANNLNCNVRKQGIKYDSPDSARDIPGFIEFHKLNVDEMLHHGLSPAVESCNLESTLALIILRVMLGGPLGESSCVSVAHCGRRLSPGCTVCVMGGLLTCVLRRCEHNSRATLTVYRSSLPLHPQRLNRYGYGEVKHTDN